MDKRIGVIGSIVLMIALLVSCGPGATPAPTPTKAPVAAPTAAPKAAEATPTAAPAAKPTTAPASQPTPAAKAPTTPIKIGILTTLTGVFAAPGADLRDGFLLYLAEKGNKLAGREVQVIVEDDEVKPDVGLTKAKKLVERDGVNLVLGVISSGVALSAGPYLAQNKKVFLITNAGADDLTQKAANPYIFRNSFANSTGGMVAADWGYKQKGWRTAVILGSDYAAGWEWTGGFARVFTDLGGKIIQELYPPLGNPDPAPFVSQLQKADVTYVFQAGADALSFVPAYAQYGVKARPQPLIGNYGITDLSILPKQGEAALGVLQGGPFAEGLDTPANKALTKAFKDKYNRDATIFTEPAYTAGRMIEKALEAVKGNIEDTDAFVKALETVEIPDAPRGAVKFDKLHNIVSPFYVSEVQRVGGQVNNMAIATYPNTTQFFKWTPEEWLKMTPLSEMKGKWVK
ncbi:MAG: ABC transporter substrate-binding protein [Dehalococcoidia bacterium]|nr:ABC transporter substrate-binding protein [Dehalococcoidia bacterium]